MDQKKDQGLRELRRRETPGVVHGAAEGILKAGKEGECVGKHCDSPCKEDQTASVEDTLRAPPIPSENVEIGRQNTARHKEGQRVGKALPEILLKSLYELPENAGLPVRQYPKAECVEGAGGVPHRDDRQAEDEPQEVQLQKVKDAGHHLVKWVVAPE